MQKAFKKQVKSLSTAITEMGNPFQESTKDLLVFDTQDIMLPSFVETFKTSESVGQNRYREFVTRRLEASSKSLFENQDFPTSLSTYGDIRTGTKSDILQCLEKVFPSQNDRQDVDMLLLDGAVVVNMLRPRAVKTFQEFSQQVFLPFLKSQG